MFMLRSLVATAILVTLAACGTTSTFPGDSTTYDSTPAAATYQPGYGVVESVSIVDATGQRGIGAGAVTGGVVGAILGSQVGSGTGRAAATVAGAGAGAYAGHQIERRTRTVGGYQLTVRMDNGNVQNIVQDNRSFQVGDRVQITNDGRVVLL